MRYLSVCSGIEAASVAWDTLGWKAVGFSEIEAFPCAVLSERFPDVPNFGDMTKYADWPLKEGDFDILIGGTPCQSFSVAGLRKGLADPRGNLALVYLGIVDRFKPNWVVWENVPGVLSSGDGKDFGAFLSGLSELGYGFAYRVLDAQYFGVAQRRRRVFVIGHREDWRLAAGVLFESEGNSRNYPQRGRNREKSTQDILQGIEAPGTISVTRANTMSNGIGVRLESAPTLDTTGPCAIITQADPEAIGLDYECNSSSIDDAIGPLLKGSPTGGGHPLPAVMCPSQSRVQSIHETGQGFWVESDVAGTLRAEGENRPSRPSHVIAHTLTACHRSSEDGCGRGIPLVEAKAPVVAPLNLQNVIRHNETETRTGVGIGDVSDPAFTLQAGHHHGVIVAEQDAPEVAACIRSSGTGTARIEDQTGQDNVVAVLIEQPLALANCLTRRMHKGINSTVDEGQTPIIASTITRHNADNVSTAGANPGVVNAISANSGVRRLTPVECERLQGFPDNWTAINFRGHCPAADGLRYKALGNSMAVPVIRWIGQRIQLVSELTE
jgi:DNA (cytosine-5)-methyltransferase 1